jgi:hypothetical protein
MKLSRRDALRAGGGLLAGAGLAGCVEQRVTRVETNAESSTTWGLTPGTGDDLDAEGFAAYVDEMESVYGDSGVWGFGDPEDAGFETAYVQRLPVVREPSGQAGGARPTLTPDDVDRTGGFPVVDAAVSMYRLGESRYRYWLWAAVDVRNETFARDADATVLWAGVSVDSGTVDATASVARAGDEVTPTPSEDRDVATVDLAGETVGRFPLRASTNTVGTDDRSEAQGYYVVEWTGGVEGVQSIAGFCEVERNGDYDLRWSVGAGYRTEERESGE